MVETTKKQGHSDHKVVNPRSVVVPGKGLCVVARNFCLALPRLPGCCLAKHAYLFRCLCTTARMYVHGARNNAGCSL